MRTRDDLIRDRACCRSKSVGCLLGLAIGDTLGELGRSDDYRRRYGIVTNLYGDTQSTDDTEFAVLTAKIVLACGGHLTNEVVHQHWMKHIVDEGIQARSGMVALGARANLERGLSAPLSGMDNVHAYDDGVAMRIAPVGIVWAGEPQKAAQMAAIDGQISHSADGIWAGSAMAASVAAAMVDASVDEIIAAGTQQIPQDSWLGRRMALALKICDEEKTIFDAWERLHNELWTPQHSAAPEAVPQAYAVFKLLGDQGFRACVVAGSNFGRDADTLGAMLGALCGAKYGIEAIPDGWIDRIRKPRGICLPFAAQYDLVELAEQLSELIR